MQLGSRVFVGVCDVAKRGAFREARRRREIVEAAFLQCGGGLLEPVGGFMDVVGGTRDLGLEVIGGAMHRCGDAADGLRAGRLLLIGHFLGLLGDRVDTL